MDVWACFPLFHLDILSSKKAGRTRELGTSPVEQRSGCWESAVVALEELLHASGQAVLEKKGTHLGQARLLRSHSKSGMTWLADARVPACPRNPVLGLVCICPHSRAAPHKVSTWDNHLDLKTQNPNQSTIQELRAPAFPQGGFLLKPTIHISSLVFFPVLSPVTHPFLLSKRSSSY